MAGKWEWPSKTYETSKHQVTVLLWILQGLPGRQVTDEAGGARVRLQELMAEHGVEMSDSNLRDRLDQLGGDVYGSVIARDHIDPRTGNVNSRRTFGIKLAIPESALPRPKPLWARKDKQPTPEPVTEVAEATEDAEVVELTGDDPTADGSTGSVFDQLLLMQGQITDMMVAVLELESRTYVAEAEATAAREVTVPADPDDELLRRLGSANEQMRFLQRDLQAAKERVAARENETADLRRALRHQQAMTARLSDKVGRVEDGRRAVARMMQEPPRERASA